MCRSPEADVVQQSLDAGLLEELQIHLAPVLRRAGMRLFDRVDPGPDAAGTHPSGRLPDGHPPPVSRHRVNAPEADPEGTAGWWHQQQRLQRTGTQENPEARLHYRPDDSAYAQADHEEASIPGQQWAAAISARVASGRSGSLDRGDSLMSHLLVRVGP